MAEFVDVDYRSTTNHFADADQVWSDAGDDRTVKSRLDDIDLRIDGLTPGVGGTMHDSFAFVSASGAPNNLPPEDQRQTFQTSESNYAFIVNLPQASNGQYWVIFVDNRTNPTSLESVEGRLPVTSEWRTNSTVTVGASTYIVYSRRNLGGAPLTTRVRLVRNN